MSSYPASIRRCQHIKVNGTQCGSPALREAKYCYFHMRWHASRMSVILKEREHWIAGLPTLEDANSIQVGLAGDAAAGHARDRSQDRSAVAVCDADSFGQPETYVV